MATPLACLEETVSVAEVGLEDECRERVVDLSTCQNVMYEARNSVPGVKFVEEGRDGWVKVVRKRRKRMKKVTGVEDLGSSSESELDVTAASRVEYRVDPDDGASGLCIQTGRIRKWVKIAPSPIALRTRARINVMVILICAFTLAVKAQWGGRSLNHNNKIKLHDTVCLFWGVTYHL